MYVSCLGKVRYTEMTLRKGGKSGNRLRSIDRFESGSTSSWPKRNRTVSD